MKRANGHSSRNISTFNFAICHSAWCCAIIPFFSYKRPLGFWLKKKLKRCASGYIAAGFALARTVLYLSNFNRGIFNGCGRSLWFRWLEVGGIETGLEGSQNKAGELAVGKVSDFYCRKGMKKKPLICMSFAVAFQGFLPVEAIFAATLGFRLRQCGNQLAILAQNYGMDQWIAVTMVRDSCCLHLLAASVDWSMPYGYEYVGTAPAFVREDRKVRVGCF